MPTFELDRPERLLFALLALPLAALFVARRRPVAWLSGYAFLWQRLAPGGARTSRRYQDVMRWAWQLGVLVLIALAAAGPGTAGRRGPHRVLLAVDTSASMGARRDGLGPTRLERGLDAARAWLREDTAVTLVAGAPWPHVVLADAPPEVARAALTRLTPSAAALDAEALARVIAREAVGMDDAVAISDGCGAGGAGFDERLPPGVGWIAPGRGEPSGNIGLSDPVVTPSARDRGWRLVVRVANGGSRVATADVAVVGMPLVARQVQLAPGEVRPVALELPATLSGQVVVALAQRDDLAHDDRVVLALAAVPRAAISLVSERRVGGELRASPFWSRALEALGDIVDRADSQMVARVADVDPEPSGVGPFRVTILDDVRLRGALPPGNYLLFGVRGGPAQPAGPAVADLGAWQVDRASPLMRSVELADLLVRRGCALRVERDDKVLASSSHGPLVVQGRRPGVRFVAFAFALADSNLYALAAFPLLLRNAIEELGRAREPGLAAAIDRRRARELVELAPVGTSEWMALDREFERLSGGAIPPGAGWLRAGEFVYGVDAGLASEGVLAVPPGRDPPTPREPGPARRDLRAPIAWAALAWLLVGLLVPRLWPRDLRA